MQRHIFIAIVAVLDADIAAAVRVSVYDIELKTAAIWNHFGNSLLSPGFQ